MRIHTLCALITLLCLTGPSTMTELALIPALFAFLIRVQRHWRTWGALIFNPVAVLLLLWIAWSLIGLIWSPDRSQGLSELGAVRWAAVAIVLWPVAERRAWLLAALIAGFHLGQLTQLAHGLGVVFDIPALRWNRMPGRWSGWWDPVVGGSLLTALVGLHLPAAAWGRGWWRVAGLLGSAAGVAGVVATGTRGAWLATAALVGLVCIAACWRSAHRVRTVGILLLLVAVTGGVVGVVGGQGLKTRVQDGVREVSRALEAGDYSSDTGARLGMAFWAWEAASTHPIAGVGTGGYRAWVQEAPINPAIDAARHRIHAHAHNSLLHIAATGGAVSILLALALFGFALHSAARFVPGDGPPGYRDGPLFALLGLALVSAFDAIHINAQTAALLGALVALRLSNRPVWLEASDPPDATNKPN